MGQGNEIRQRILKKRDELDPANRREKSLRIGAALLDLDAVMDAESIFIYVNFRSEVETLDVIKKFMAMGKQVSVPLTRVAQRRLEIVSITDPDSQLVPGYCNIPEPSEEHAKANGIDPDQLDLVILPGSVFDLSGGRFGYGGGFYDRLLAQIPDAHRVALAFDMQVVDALPLESHDEILDMIVTESRIIAGRR
jgi:5-formyltetrahydrofolate cyclo-ligase